MNTEINALDFKDPGTMSDELLDVPGFVNELKNHTLAVAPRPNAPLAFAGALAMLAHLSGRSYIDERGSHTNLYLAALGEFMSREIACGNRLNFGPFGVTLKMQGGFRGANEPFDETKNSIGVCLIPGNELKRAVKMLKPVNVTEETRWHITGTLQRFPYEVYDQLVADGLRRFTLTGYFDAVNVQRPDEGIWIENDAEEKLLTATITKTDFAYSDCTLEGPLPRGDYWIVIQFRYLDEPNLIHCRRRIKVV